MAYKVEIYDLDELYAKYPNIADYLIKTVDYDVWVFVKALQLVDNDDYLEITYKHCANEDEIRMMGFDPAIHFIWEETDEDEE
jgi:hypothetical protein